MTGNRPELAETAQRQAETEVPGAEREGTPDRLRAERDDQAPLAATGSTFWRSTAPLRWIARFARQSTRAAQEASTSAGALAMREDNDDPPPARRRPGTAAQRLMRTSHILEQRLAGPAARSIHLVGEKIAPLRLALSDTARPRLNLLIPTIDQRYFFGGYIAKLALAQRLAEGGSSVRIVVVDYCKFDPQNCRRQLNGFNLGSIFDDVEFAHAYDRSAPLDIHPADAFIATTWWTAHIAHRAVSELGRDRFVYLIQEYEPMTFPMGSFAALAAQTYSFPHYAVFSTEFLREFFRTQQIGVYAGSPVVGDHSSVAFRNAITDVGAVGRETLAARRSRRLLFYGRPEEHAARNMFELGVVALSRSIEEGAFAGVWEFTGIGTAGRSRSVKLGSGRTMRLVPRRDLDSYRRILLEHDVGLSLMYTPHPSLVPIEMASAGMIVVTNTFANKTAEALMEISRNLLPVEPTIEAIAAGLHEAARRSSDLAARVRGASVDWPTAWERSFDSTTMEAIGRFIAASTSAASP